MLYIPARSPHLALDRRNYDAATFAVPAGKPAVHGLDGFSGASAAKKAEDHDEERLGTRRPNQGRFSFRAWARTCRSRARCADFPSGRGYFVASQVHGFSDFPGWLAPTQRNAPKSCRQAYPRFCLRRLLPGPWGHGNRSESMGSQVRQPGNLCLAGGVGRPHHRRISRAACRRVRDIP
jgi:hypothetical protein